MAEPHLDHPGDVSWFPGKGPAAVLGPCPHTKCPHDSARCVAWGPDFEHYTLDECSVPAEFGGCAGQCRAWASEVPEVDRRGRARIRYGWGPWLRVDVEPRPSPAATDTVPDLPITAAPLGEEFVAAVEARVGNLADLVQDDDGTTAAHAYRLGATRAIAATVEEISARGWLIFDPARRG